MKKYSNGILIIMSFLLLMVSCQEVIDVDLPTEEPRLIIDALVRVDTNEAFTKVTVKVSETSSFFESIPAANLQQITLTNLDLPGGGINPPVLIEETPGSGIYSKVFDTDFLTQGSLFLQIDFEDEFYVATARFVPAVPIDNLVQGDGILFDEDDTEVIVTFTDSDERDDFYLFDFDFGNYLVTEDEFYQGQQFAFSYFYDEALAVGDTLNISIMGVDEDFYTYMDQLILQSEEDFGPFETPALTVRGNFINATNIDNNNNFDNLNDINNFALGYFAIVQEYKETLVVQE
ncbi:hypothetical protein C5O00_10255 [Pukyongia salina]|uniref:DUF4249 family protein n=2 Tax=Pukyongia salina TaxID=2094025 RepID=A0A2S0HY39_9FLAO|nr:hypothetical protein C5O00_10255 [Pukyongia salina]